MYDSSSTLVNTFWIFLLIISACRFYLQYFFGLFVVNLQTVKKLKSNFNWNEMKWNEGRWQTIITNLLTIYTNQMYVLVLYWFIANISN